MLSNVLPIVLSARFNEWNNGTIGCNSGWVFDTSTFGSSAVSILIISWYIFLNTDLTED